MDNAIKAAENQPFLQLQMCTYPQNYMLLLNSLIYLYAVFIAINYLVITLAFRNV